MERESQPPPKTHVQSFSIGRWLSTQRWKELLLDTQEALFRVANANQFVVSPFVESLLDYSGESWPHEDPVPDLSHLKGDLPRLRVDYRISREFDEAKEHLVALVLAAFCWLHKVDYLQGMHEVVGALTFLQPTPSPGELFCLFEALLRAAAPHLTPNREELPSETNSSFAQRRMCILFRHLLLFHLPAIGTEMDDMFGNPFWNFDWFDTLGAHKFRDVRSWLSVWEGILSSAWEDGCSKKADSNQGSLDGQRQEKTCLVEWFFFLLGYLKLREEEVSLRGAHVLLSSECGFDGFLKENQSEGSYPRCFPTQQVVTLMEALQRSTPASFVTEVFQLSATCRSSNLPQVPATIAPRYLPDLAAGSTAPATSDAPIYKVASLLRSAWRRRTASDAAPPPKTEKQAGASRLGDPKHEPQDRTFSETGEGGVNLRSRNVKNSPNFCLSIPFSKFEINKRIVRRMKQRLRRAAEDSPQNVQMGPNVVLIDVRSNLVVQRRVGEGQEVAKYLIANQLGVSEEIRDEKLSRHNTKGAGGSHRQKEVEGHHQRHWSSNSFISKQHTLSGLMQCPPPSLVSIIDGTAFSYQAATETDELSNRRDDTTSCTASTVAASSTESIPPLEGDENESLESVNGCFGHHLEKGSAGRTNTNDDVTASERDETTSFTHQVISFHPNFASIKVLKSGAVDIFEPDCQQPNEFGDELGFDSLDKLIEAVVRKDRKLKEQKSELANPTLWMVVTNEGCASAADNSQSIVDGVFQPGSGSIVDELCNLKGAVGDDLVTKSYSRNLISVKVRNAQDANISEGERSRMVMCVDPYFRHINKTGSYSHQTLHTVRWGHLDFGERQSSRTWSQSGASKTRFVERQAAERTSRTHGSQSGPLSPQQDDDHLVEHHRGGRLVAVQNGEIKTWGALMSGAVGLEVSRRLMREGVSGVVLVEDGVKGIFNALAEAHQSTFVSSPSSNIGPTLSPVICELSPTGYGEERVIGGMLAGNAQWQKLNLASARANKIPAFSGFKRVPPIENPLSQGNSIDLGGLTPHHRLNEKEIIGPLRLHDTEGAYQAQPGQQIPHQRQEEGLTMASLAHDHPSSSAPGSPSFDSGPPSPHSTVLQSTSAQEGAGMWGWIQNLTSGFGLVGGLSGCSAPPNVVRSHMLVKADHRKHETPQDKESSLVQDNEHQRNCEAVEDAYLGALQQGMVAKSVEEMIPAGSTYQEPLPDAAVGDEHSSTTEESGTFETRPESYDHGASAAGLIHIQRIGNQHPDLQADKAQYYTMQRSFTCPVSLGSVSGGNNAVVTLESEMSRDGSSDSDTNRYIDEEQIDEKVWDGSVVSTEGVDLEPEHREEITKETLPHSTTLHDASFVSSPMVTSVINPNQHKHSLLSPCYTTISATVVECLQQHSQDMTLHNPRSRNRSLSLPPSSSVERDQSVACTRWDDSMAEFIDVVDTLVGIRGDVEQAIAKGAEHRIEKGCCYYSSSEIVDDSHHDGSLISPLLDLDSSRNQMPHDESLLIDYGSRCSNTNSMSSLSERQVTDHDESLIYHFESPESSASWCALYFDEHHTSREGGRKELSSDGMEKGRHSQSGTCDEGATSGKIENLIEKAIDTATSEGVSSCSNQGDSTEKCPFSPQQLGCRRSSVCELSLPDKQLPHVGAMTRRSMTMVVSPNHHIDPMVNSPLPVERSPLGSIEGRAHMDLASPMDLDGDHLRGPVGRRSVTIDCVRRNVSPIATPHARIDKVPQTNTEKERTRAGVTDFDFSLGSPVAASSTHHPHPHGQNQSLWSCPSNVMPMQTMQTQQQPFHRPQTQPTSLITQTERDVLSHTTEDMGPNRSAGTRPLPAQSGSFKHASVTQPTYLSRFGGVSIHKRNTFHEPARGRIAIARHQPRVFVPQRTGARATTRYNAARAAQAARCGDTGQAPQRHPPAILVPLMFKQRGLMMPPTRQLSPMSLISQRGVRRERSVALQPCVSILPHVNIDFIPPGALPQLMTLQPTGSPPIPCVPNSGPTRNSGGDRGDRGGRGGGAPPPAIQGGLASRRA
eukprot:GHVN01066703.1.p1 GENE.GHVN01066703.1~~GHVN01066703.1.p1  ORF type:complete len:2030 (-),score=265.68 GHVN01066703.1:4972-11061(-)